MSVKSHDRAQARDPARIEAELDQSRAAMSNTLDALQHKLTPGALIDEASNYIRNSGGGEFASNLKATITQNPVPVALVGMGLAWLALSGRRGRYSSRLHSSVVEQYPEDSILRRHWEAEAARSELQSQGAQSYSLGEADAETGLEVHEGAIPSDLQAEQRSGEVPPNDAYRLRS
jgi:hypothetical protein